MGAEHSRVCLEINLETLTENFLKIRERVAPCRIISVLKANAYGLGVEEIAGALAGAGTDGFGVAELSEAMQLLKFNIPVQILGNVFDDEIAPAVANNIILPAGDIDTVRLINREAARQGKVAKCHYLIDTGMGRLGIPVHEAYDFVRGTYYTLKNIDFCGIYSHFPVAYREGSSYTEHQVDMFCRLLQNLKKEGLTFESVHIANSDAINNFPYTFRPPFNSVRTGINLHGSFDQEGRRALDIRPVLNLKSRIVSVRELKKGSYIGYGLTYRLEKDTRVGVVAAGYADGLPLALSNRGDLLVNGRRCPVLGRVSMDYTTISLENVPDAEKGDTVVCLGAMGDEVITVEDWAELKGTHAYEVICSFGNRVERKYTAQLFGSSQESVKVRFNSGHST